MSFPPPLPNNPMFQAFAQAGVPPMPRFQIPMGGLPVPLMPTGAMSMGVTVPAGVASISAPPIRHQNSAIIAAPPIMSIPGQPQLLYPPHINPQIISHQKPPKNDASKNSQFSITVFVGNITDRASDMLIRQLLSKCGSVNNWKRVQGPNGKLQAFGFCEYSDPESAMRAIRLLHDFEIVDKKLIVRVDAKTQEKLDEYRKLKYPNQQGGKNDGDEKAPKDSQKAQDIVDEATQDEDKIVRHQFSSVLKEHEIELAKEIEPKVHKNRHHVPKDTKQENINELEMEDDKRNLIHREIDKFRDTYKKYDEEKEEEKRKKEESRSKRDRKHYSKRSRSRDRDDRSRSRRSRDRDRDRRSNRDRRSSSIEDDLERQRSESPLDEEEMLLRRRQEKLIREKEHSYQRRLKDWEAREKRKAKEYDRECAKESRSKEEEEIEKQKLKQFLQDYDDDKHDSKYYKGRIFDRRLADRQREIEQDEFDRDQERKELEELRKKLSDEGHPDPESEVLKRLNVKTGALSDITDRIKVLMNEARNNIAFLNDQDSSGSASNPNASNGASVKTFGFAGMKISATGATTSSTNENVSAVPNGAPSFVTTADVANENSNSSVQILNEAKRKRLMMSDVFNSTEDDEANAQSARKRRLPPNALLEDSNTDSNLSTGSNKQSSSQISQEEKRRQIKTLIDKIPTSKNELFIYNIEWDVLDNVLMERRIRPWINKKISDYIGEEEQTLLNFICKKLLSQTSAQSLLDDVAMVLDDEAQVFVVKLWRLLIYEIEAKKMGLNK